MSAEAVTARETTGETKRRTTREIPTRDVTGRRDAVRPFVGNGRPDPYILGATALLLGLGLILVRLRRADFFRARVG